MNDGVKIKIILSLLKQSDIPRMSIESFFQHAAQAFAAHPTAELHIGTDVFEELYMPVNPYIETYVRLIHGSWDGMYAGAIIFICRDTLAEKRVLDEKARLRQELDAFSLDLRFLGNDEINYHLLNRIAPTNEKR